MKIIKLIKSDVPCPNEREKRFFVILLMVVIPLLNVLALFEKALS